MMKVGNWPLLMLAIEHAIKHPEQYYQGTWRTTTECGTTRCIAGWIAFFAGYRDGSSMGAVHSAAGGVRGVEGAAVDALELDDEQYGPGETELFALSLFDGTLTFSDVLAAVHDLAKADGVVPTPLIVDEMINHGIINDWMAY